MRTTILAFIVLAANAGCLRSTQFQCDTDQSCGAAGKCESTGFCSFADSGCASGRKYSDSAGPNAGKCTGESSGIDGGIDGKMIDGSMSMIDAPSRCPASFTALPNAGAHVYKMLTTPPMSWTQQENACHALSTNAYLAVPDNQPELDAMDTASGQTIYWVGVDDIVTEGTFVSVLMMPQTFLPWQPPAPDDAGPGEDCVEALVAMNKFNDDRCNTNLPAMCECDP